MRRSILVGFVAVTWLWPTQGVAQLRRLRFDRPSHTEFFRARQPDGMATLRTAQEWAAFTRRYWQAPDGDSVLPPRLDFKRFMAVALWRLGPSDRTLPETGQLV